MKNVPVIIVLEFLKTKSLTVSIKFNFVKAANLLCIFSKAAKAVQPNNCKALPKVEYLVSLLDCSKRYKCANSRDHS